MIEVYKRLPGTNCGECGEITCMALALKVNYAQRKITECPYIEKKDGEAFNQRSVSTLENNYRRVSRELEEEIRNIDFEEAAEAIGGDFEAGNGGGVIRLKMMNYEYEVRREGLFENDRYCHDSWSKIIIYDYVRRMGRVPLTGDWVSLGHFPNTASHSKAFQKNAEDSIAERFNNNLPALRDRCAEQGGVEVSGRIKADYVYGFNLLPHVPIYLCFWDADEEYPASCKLHVDRSAEAYIDIEYLAYLLEWFVRVLVGSGSAGSTPEVEV